MTSEIDQYSETSNENQIIKVKDLKPKMNNLEIIFKVIEIGEPREVSSRRTGEIHQIADAIVGDETGIVSVPLWNSSIDEMKIGTTYKLENGYTGLFRGNLQLKIGRHSTVNEIDDKIETVNEELDMSAQNHRTSRDRHYYQPRQRSQGYQRYNSYSRRSNDSYSRRYSGRRRW
jgi:replication factor A1